MRTVAIYENPIMEPGVCAKCGSQQRDWFVDLGLNITGEKEAPYKAVNVEDGEPYESPNHWFDGAIMYCNVCINNLFDDVCRKFTEFKENHIVKEDFNGLGTNDSATAGDIESTEQDTGNPSGNDSESKSENRITVSFEGASGIQS